MPMISFDIFKIYEDFEEPHGELILENHINHLI